MDLDDRLGARAPLLDYCDAADRGDVPGIVGCFTSAGEVDYGPRARARGRSALLELFRTFLGSNEATSHHLSNVRLRPNDRDTVDATSYVLAWHRLVGGQQLLIAGRYVDRIVRQGDVWRLASRRLEVHGAQGPPVPFNRLSRDPH